LETELRQREAAADWLWQEIKRAVAKSGKRRPGLERFARPGLGIREVLQGVEDALIDAGYDDFVVATNRGTFR
jgi:hypothetical protein